jgi:predicted metalloprotease with PDZ domain
MSLARAAEHLVEVRMELSGGPSQRDVQLPVWNALYQVRDFAQYVNWVKAETPDGKPLAVRKLDKSTWRISGADHGVRVEYEIFADQPGPFGVQINLHHAFFNLAQVLMYPVDSRKAHDVVEFKGVPAGWRIATPLAALSDAEFEADDYDHLVDGPVEIGTFQDASFDEGGARYRVVVDADPADYDMQKIVSALHSIVRAETAWMADRPFDHYVFLYHFPRGPAGGGMEHTYSTAIDVSANRLTENVQALAGVTAHEFFHLWNVKRIRPQSLEPIDYTKENYTTALWFSEGFTSTVGPYILLRAGLLDETHYLEDLGREITELERSPANRTQSAEESSLDAWLEKYGYYRSPQRSISYYTKGEVLGVLLDLQLREASHGAGSLRDVFQWMNRHYAKQGRFFPDSEGVRQAAEAVGQTDLRWFFQKYVSGTGEIPYDDFFRTVGLRLVRRSATVADPGFTLSYAFEALPAVIAIRSGSEAERAGLAVGDSIVEINSEAPGFRAELQLTAPGPGGTLRLKVRNRRGERELSWTLGSREEVEFELKDVDNINPQQRARRAAWLAGETQRPGEARP